MKQLLAAAPQVAAAIILFPLVIWVIASCAAAYVALLVFWPFLSVIYLIVWPIARFIGHVDTSGWGISLQKRSGRLRRNRVGGSDLPLGKRVFVTADPEFSVELAAPRWLEAVYLILWAPFVLTFPLFIATSLLQLASQEQPQVVLEWSSLALGAMLLSGFYVSLVACVSWGAHEFVRPGIVGRRLAIPFVGHALCITHRDVCAVEVGEDASRGDHVRFIRTGGEPMEIRASARFMVGDCHAAADLLPLAELLARAAQVPLRRTPCGNRN